MDLSHLGAPDTPIAIIGLGYVGLPLAVEFGKLRPVVGFDIKPERIAELQSGRDSTRETTPEALAAARHLRYTADPEALRPCRLFIVTVPTPVDDYKRPDLRPLLKASETVGKALKPGDLVIDESTVYPGCTEVLEVAGSKWNFLPFRPGLVGGHCIGVDPYYLTHKAVAIGYHPEVILAGRRINDRMGAQVAERVVKRMLARGIHVCGSRILVLGLAFKENCPDLRNTRVVDIVNALVDYSATVDCYDPWIDREEARREYGLDCLPERPAPGSYDAIVLAVAHRDLVDPGAAALRALGKPQSILYDVKSVLAADDVDGRL